MGVAVEFKVIFTMLQRGNLTRYAFPRRTVGTREEKSRRCIFYLDFLSYR